jgi:hypothetical protein
MLDVLMLIVVMPLKPVVAESVTDQPHSKGENIENLALDPFLANV